jgi:hypothetical protein
MLQYREEAGKAVAQQQVFTLMLPKQKEVA